MCIGNGSNKIARYRSSDLPGLNFPSSYFPFILVRSSQCSILGGASAGVCVCVHVIRFSERVYQVGGRREGNPQDTSAAESPSLSFCPSLSPSLYHFASSLQQPNDDEAVDSAEESEEHYLCSAHTHTCTSRLIVPGRGSGFML